MQMPVQSAHIHYFMRYIRMCTHMGIKNWFGIKRAHLFLENNKLNVCLKSVIFCFTATLWLHYIVLLNQCLYELLFYFCCTDWQLYRRNFISILSIFFSARSLSLFKCKQNIYFYHIGTVGRFINAQCVQMISLFLCVDLPMHFELLAVGWRLLPDG